MLRHRDSWAEERKAPTVLEWKEAIAKGGDWPPKILREQERDPTLSLEKKTASPKVIRRAKSS